MGGILVAGTTSDAGKSVVTAGICRWLWRRGVKVAPFKAQNMSNNSAVVVDGAGRGGEIGRAQALQAVAAGLEPQIRFNPVLLKPGKAVRVQIPEGVIAVKPMPKAGWTLETVKGKYEKSYDLYGAAVGEGVKEVVWSGGDLPDEFYDEFVFRAMLTDGLAAGAELYFPTVQECDGAAERWIEIPAKGQDAEALEFPAPGLKLLPKK